MRAVVYHHYGPPEVLRIEEVARPEPDADEVLIKVHATTVNRTDCAIRGGADLITRLGYSLVTTGSPVKALRRPVATILGSELAGEVVAVGAAVSRFTVGQRVFGVNAGRFGAHAEYVCMREGGPLAEAPNHMSYAEAAAVCDGALLALGNLRRVALRAEQRILIYGASGSIGTAAVQLATAIGARVAAVCGTKNVELVRSLGADAVIDYQREDFTKTSATYDIIFDAVGKSSYARCKPLLSPGGIYIPTDGWRNLFLAMWPAPFGARRVMVEIPPHYRQSDVRYLKELIEAGKYRAVIDRRYPLEQVVEATRYVETQKKVGNVVLMVSGDGDA
jgi:NADPH:quinone reductase-like Zn-dependent oxidoreductase